MPESFSKLLASKSKAEIYSEVNDFQQQYGRRLALLTKINEGAKILDMGCGTGEVTSFLAEKVGKEGEVVGVDPDAERIETAIKKHASGSRGNITFKHGDSSANFPNYDEEYYDLHFSNHVFHWLNPEEKGIFLKTAYRCLKPGGQIAITCYEDEQEVAKQAKRLLFHDDKNAKRKPITRDYPLKKADAETLLQKAGFAIVSSEYCALPVSFASADDFVTWVCVTEYYAEKEISPAQKKDIASKFVNDDGTVTFCDASTWQIVARKNRNE